MNSPSLSEIPLGMKTSARAAAILGARNLFRSRCERTEVRAPVGFRRWRSEGTTPQWRIGASTSTVDSHLRGILRMRTILFCTFILSNVSGVGSPAEELDGAFELPAGFHIYRAAGPELSGGSYALAFDGEGRLLVGDGNAVRRLIDKDGDGVFDSFEVIATGLGWRGPQGLLVCDDRLYAVGGDGIQVFEGYRAGGPLVHKGRIGTKFN